MEVETTAAWPSPNTKLQDGMQAAQEHDSSPPTAMNGSMETTSTNDTSFPNVPTTPSRSRGPEMVGPFVLGLTLGRGQTGKVRLGVHKDTGFKVAIKIVSKRLFKEDRRQRQRVEREVAILKLIDHPHVMKLHDVWETRRHLFIVMEHVDGGELFDYILSKGRLPRHEALRFFAQIVQGLEHCHNFSICHRDLKPENILLDSNRNIKIADFGMATVMRYGAALNTSCGSPHYTSPEVVSGGRYDGKLSDVWSAGVVLYALVTAQLPFDHETTVGLLKIVRRGVFKIPEHVDPDISDLIRRMLTVQPDKRIRMSEIKYHPCFQTPMSVMVPPSIRSNSYASLSKARRRASDFRHDDFAASFFPPEVPCDCLECLSGTAKKGTCARRQGLDVRTAQPLQSEKDIDRGVLDDLYHLGWGSREELTAILTSERPNLEQIFYHLLLRRKQDRLQQLKKLRMTGTHVFSATPKPTSSGAFSFPTPQYPPAMELPVPVPGLNRAIAMDDEPSNTNTNTKFLPPAIPEYGEAEPITDLMSARSKQGEPTSQMPSPTRRNSTASITSEGVIRSPSRELPPPGPSAPAAVAAGQAPVSAAELLGADRPRFRRPQVELTPNSPPSTIVCEEVTSASSHSDSPPISVAGLEVSCGTVSPPPVIPESKARYSPPHSCPVPLMEADPSNKKAIPALVLTTSSGAPSINDSRPGSTTSFQSSEFKDWNNNTTGSNSVASSAHVSPSTSVSPLEKDAALNALASSPRRHFQKIRASIMERRRSPPASVPTATSDRFGSEENTTLPARYAIPKLNFPPAALPLGVPLLDEDDGSPDHDTRINIESLSQQQTSNSARTRDVHDQQQQQQQQQTRPPSFLHFGVESYVTARRHSAVEARPDLWTQRKPLAEPTPATTLLPTIPSLPPHLAHSADPNNPSASSDVVISITPSTSQNGYGEKPPIARAFSADETLRTSSLSSSPSPSSSPNINPADYNSTTNSTSRHSSTSSSSGSAHARAKSAAVSSFRLSLPLDTNSSPPLHPSTSASASPQFHPPSGTLVTPRFHRVRPIPSTGTTPERRGSIVSPPTTPSTKRSWFSSLFNLAPDYGRSAEPHRRASSSVVAQSVYFPSSVQYPHTSPPSDLALPQSASNNSTASSSLPPVAMLPTTAHAATAHHHSNTESSMGISSPRSASPTVPMTTGASAGSTPLTSATSSKIPPPFTLP